MNRSPLAEKIRPQTLDDVVGQGHLFGKSAMLRRVLESGTVPNLVFFGPSGTGKTTVAEIIAGKSGKTMRKINATSASLADIKQVLSETETIFGVGGILLYIDEIQYFNKKQQQSLLEFMEDGRITLICSTTENPYFAIYSAVLSRCSVFEFKPVSAKDIERALRRALGILDVEFHFDVPQSGPIVENRAAAIEVIAGNSSGDVRKAVGALELCYLGTDGRLTGEAAVESIGNFALKLDRDGNEHYDLLSALQKSIRGSDPDAALFYLARLLEGGDLMSPCRRLLVIASEDIGLAYPLAAVVTKACVDSAFQLGLPEARIPLAEACVLLSTAPKSNASYLAYDLAAQDVRRGRGLHMPHFLRDSKQPEADKNKDYQYPHLFKHHYVEQQYLPNDLAGTIYYQYGDNKNESSAKEYWDKIKNRDSSED